MPESAKPPPRNNIIDAEGAYVAGWSSSGLFCHATHKVFKMKLTIIPTGFFKLDGGAMFGVVPKRLWQKVQPADENNLCTWAMNCLLIESGDRKILVDCGMGDKQDARWRSFFEPHGDDTLIGSLALRGVAPEEITDVFLTHLHFDHCGGAVRYDENQVLVPTFPTATYWSNELHWQAAMVPNERERASFLKENFVPLQAAGKLKFIDVQKDLVEWLPGIQVRYTYGHTLAMMTLHIETPQGTYVYSADSMPSSFHLNLPWIMAYDMHPLTTLEEKSWLLENAVEKDWNLIFEHDPLTVCATLMKNEAGRTVIRDRYHGALPTQLLLPI